jgi:hypothetical protein
MEEENLRCYVRIRPNPQQKKKDCISYDDASSSSGSARVGTTIKLRNTNSYSADESKAFTFDKVRSWKELPQWLQWLEMQC